MPRLPYKENLASLALLGEKCVHVPVRKGGSLGIFLEELAQGCQIAFKGFEWHS